MTEGNRQDVLSALAPLLRIRPRLEDFCHFGGHWTAEHEAEARGWAAFHIVTRGRCEVERVGHPPLQLEAGDILLLPHGDAHVVRSVTVTGPTGARIDTRHVNALKFKDTVGVESDTELVCGALHFEAASESLIVAALPDVIVLKPSQLDGANRFAPIVYAIRDELEALAPGAEAIAANLATAIFVMMLRMHLEASAPANGLLRLLAERQTAQAALAILRAPEHDWTLEDLAAVAGASRATLVRAFRRATGAAPLAFVADHRLNLAHQALRTSELTLAQIAADVGYSAEGALSRAFLKRFGIRPGEVRRGARR